MAKKIITQLIPLTVGVLIFSLSIVLYIFAFTEPGSAPPGGNVPTPLNVGSTAQTKTGDLTLPNIYLNATTFEGNINKVDWIVGNDDLFLKGDATETSPVHLAGSQISSWVGGIERLRIDSLGDIYILGLTTCDTIDTDASGKLACGTDDTGISISDDYGRSGVATDLYEGIVTLSSKYLGISDKAADSDLLDGLDSTFFLDTSATAQTKTGKLTLSLATDDLLTLIRSGTTKEYTFAEGTDGAFVVKDELAVRLKIDSIGDVYIPKLTTCDTINTDASGKLACGTDETGVANAFANIADSVGIVKFSASGEDTLRLATGTGLSVAYDAGTKQVTYSIDATWTDNEYVNVTGDTMAGKLTLSLATDDLLTFIRSGTTKEYTFAEGTDGAFVVKDEL
ncbi:MAG: hypothetical protein KJI71_04775, partial [Patescibacteria group bacterium]|nr:hypothetical protein [Patescibacteria group bacterium]